MWDLPVRHSVIDIYYTARPGQAGTELKQNLLKHNNNTRAVQPTDFRRYRDNNISTLQRLESEFFFSNIGDDCGHSIKSKNCNSFKQSGLACLSIIFQLFYFIQNFTVKIQQNHPNCIGEKIQYLYPRMFNNIVYCFCYGGPFSNVRKRRVKTSLNRLSCDETWWHVRQIHHLHIQSDLFALPII